uniref:HSF-type DNA-binding domain-containing protein n=1 Tax=Paramormyrops kingsleyae TaxID=1676925 RepID=A0A3B3TBR8_9TELE
MLFHIAAAAVCNSGVARWCSGCRTPLGPGFESLPGFPAKLWQLVNEPRVSSVRWDWFGFGVFIDQRRFEAELLSPIGGAFKSSSFSSFNRQLNLYGFRKVMPMPGHMGVLHHHFFNPDFRQGRPDLLVNLKRLTSTNKARIQPGALAVPAAALQYNHSLPTQYHPACYAPGDSALCIFNLAFTL